MSSETPKRHPQCILASCCVPWNAQYEFEEAAFRRNVKTIIRAGIHHLYIFGTAGEGHAVSDRQFDRIAAGFLDEVSLHDGVHPMIGVINQSLATVIERIGRAHGMGARSFQISLPNWGVLNDAELAVFFQETCGRFPDCTFLHYNLQRAGRILTGEEYGRLAATHENLVATKNSTADETRLRNLFKEAPQLRHFITELGFAKAALMDECGFLLSFASSNFQQARQFFEAGKARDAAGLEAIAADFPDLVDILKSAVGGAAHMDAAFDKLFCRVHDRSFPLRTLPPYASSDDTIFARYLEMMQSRFPQWLP
jgi:dihydrodipicolinate synthase/N-acetylneuraminate lyase